MADPETGPPRASILSPDPGDDLRHPLVSQPPLCSTTPLGCEAAAQPSGGVGDKLSSRCGTVDEGVSSRCGSSVDANLSSWCSKVDDSLSTQRGGSVNKGDMSNLCNGALGSSSSANLEEYDGRKKGSSDEFNRSCVDNNSSVSGRSFVGECDEANSFPGSRAPGSDADMTQKVAAKASISENTSENRISKSSIACSIPATATNLSLDHEKTINKSSENDAESHVMFSKNLEKFSDLPFGEEVTAGEMDISVSASGSDNFCGSEKLEFRAASKRVTEDKSASKVGVDLPDLLCVGSLGQKEQSGDALQNLCSDKSSLQHSLTNATAGNVLCAANSTKEAVSSILCTDSKPAFHVDKLILDQQNSSVQGHGVGGESSNEFLEAKGKPSIEQSSGNEMVKSMARLPAGAKESTAWPCRPSVAMSSGDTAISATSSVSNTSSSSSPPSDRISQAVCSTSNSKTISFNDVKMFSQETCTASPKEPRSLESMTSDAAASETLPSKGPSGPDVHKRSDSDDLAAVREDAKWPASQGPNSESPPTEGEKWPMSGQELGLNSSPFDGDKWSLNQGSQEPSTNSSPLDGKSSTSSITSPKTPAGQPGVTVDSYTGNSRDPSSSGASSDPVIPVMGYCPKDSCANPMTPYPTPPYPTPPYNSMSGGISAGQYPNVNVYSNSCTGYSGAASYPTPSTPSSGYTNPNTPCSSYVNPNTPTSGCGTDSTPNSSYHNPNTPGSVHQNPNTPNSTFVGTGDTPSYGQGSNSLCSSGETPNSYNQGPSNSLNLTGEGGSYGPSPPGAAPSLSTAPNSDTTDGFSSGSKASFSSGSKTTSESASAVTSSPPVEASGVGAPFYSASSGQGTGTQESLCSVPSMHRYYSSSAAPGTYGAKDNYPSSGAPGMYGAKENYPSSGAPGTYGAKDNYPSSGAPGAYGAKDYPSSGAPGTYGAKDNYPSSGAPGPYGAKDGARSNSCGGSVAGLYGGSICPVPSGSGYLGSGGGGYSSSGSSGCAPDGPLGYASLASNGLSNSSFSNYQNSGANRYQNSGSNGYQNPGSNGYQNPGSNGYQNPGSNGYQNPGSNGYQNPDSNGYQNPGSNGYQNPGSNGYQSSSSNSYQNPGSNGYQNPGSNGYQDPGSNGYQSSSSNGYQNPGSNSYVSPTTAGPTSNPAPAPSHSNPTTPASYSNPSTPVSGYGGMSTSSGYGNPKTSSVSNPGSVRAWESYNGDVESTSKPPQSSQYAGKDGKCKSSLLAEFEKCSKQEVKDALKYEGGSGSQHPFRVDLKADVPDNHLPYGASSSGNQKDSYGSSSLGSYSKALQDAPNTQAGGDGGSYPDNSLSSSLEAFNNLSKKDMAALRELLESSNFFMPSDPNWKNSELAKLMGPDGMGNLGSPEKYIIDQMARYSLANEKDKYSRGNSGGSSSTSGTQALEALAHMTNSQPHDLIIPPFMQSSLPSRASMGLSLAMGMPGGAGSNIPGGLGSIPSSFSDSFMHERFMQSNASHMMSGLMDSIPPHAMKAGYDMSSSYMASMAMSSGSAYEPWMPQMNLGDASSSSNFGPQHKGGSSSRGSSRSNTPASANYSSSPLPGYGKMQPVGAGPSSSHSSLPPSDTLSSSSYPPHLLDMVPRCETSMSNGNLSIKSGSVDSLLSSSEGPSMSGCTRPNMSGSLSHSMGDLAQRSYSSRHGMPDGRQSAYSDAYLHAAGSPQSDKVEGYRTAAKPANSIYSYITPDTYYNQPMVYLSEGTSINVEHRRMDCPCILCGKHQQNVRKHGAHNVRNHVSCVGRGRGGWYTKTSKYKLNMKVTPGLTDRPASCASNAGATRASIAESISSTISSVISNAVAARAASDQPSSSQGVGFPDAYGANPITSMPGPETYPSKYLDFRTVGSPSKSGNPAFRPAESLPGNRAPQWGSPSQVGRQSIREYGCEPEHLHNPPVRNSRPISSQFVGPGNQFDFPKKEDASQWSYGSVVKEEPSSLKSSNSESYYRRPCVDPVLPPLVEKTVNDNLGDSKSSFKKETSMVAPSSSTSGKPFGSIHNPFSELRRTNDCSSPSHNPPLPVTSSKVPEMNVKPEVKLEKKEQSESKMNIPCSLPPSDHVSVPQPDHSTPVVDTGQRDTKFTKEKACPMDGLPAEKLFKRDVPLLPSSVVSKPTSLCESRMNLTGTLKADVRLTSGGKPYELCKLPNAPVVEKEITPSSLPMPSVCSNPVKPASAEPPHVDQSRPSSPGKTKSIDAAEQLYSFNDSSVESPVPSPMQHKHKRRKLKDAFPVYQSEITTDPQSTGIKLKLKLTMPKPALPKSPSYSYTALSTHKSPASYGCLDSSSSGASSPGSSSSTSPYDLPYPEPSTSKKRKYTKSLDGPKKKKKKSEPPLDLNPIISIASITPTNPTVVLNPLKPSLAKKKRGKAADSLVYRNPGFGPALSEIKGEAQSPWGHRISPEILLKIFQYGVGDDNCIPILLRLSRVCRLWRDVALDPSLWTTADLSVPRAKLKFRSERKLYWLLTSRLTRVQHLNLGGWQEAVTPFIMRTLGSECLELRSLQLPHCNKLHADNLAAMLARCNHLERLDLTGIMGCHKPTPRGAVGQQTLQELFEQHGARLTHLNLGHNTLTGLPTILSSLASKCRQLEVLDLSRVETVGRDTLTIHLEALQGGCPLLRVLRLSLTKAKFNVASMAEQAASGGFPHLEHVYLATDDRQHVGVNDSELERILKCSTKLTLLDVRGCQQVSDGSLVRVPPWSMEHLYLSGGSCLKRYSDRLELVLRKWAASLLELDLAATGDEVVLEAALTALAEDARNLRVLNLCGSSVSAGAVARVVAGCPLLTQVNLTSCRGLPRGMKRLYGLHDLPALRRLLLQATDS